MPLYLGRFSYTTDSVKAMLANPHDRAKAASEAAENTTVLLTTDEAQEALGKAAAAAYRPPAV